MSVFTWLADHLLAARGRRQKARAEVADNDARARQLQMDLDRWMIDHDRKLEEELRRIVNTRGAEGHLYSGVIRSECEHAMSAALEAYRNEASLKVRAFEALARGEGRDHGAIRESAPTLTLTDGARAALATWRERPYPVAHTIDAPLRPTDPSADDPEVAVLESNGGLSWRDAADRDTI